MEQYLIDQYGVIDCGDSLTSVEDVEDFVQDLNLFQCGQGYFNDEATVILKASEKFYKVVVGANITSSKQEFGDRLYWVDSSYIIDFEEIEKPQPKNIPLTLTEQLKSALSDCLFILHNTGQYVGSNIIVMDEYERLLNKEECE